jgi:endoglycosylceramidase
VIARAVLVLVVTVLAAATYPGALLVSLATRLGPPPDSSPTPPGTMPWLHVAHPSGASPYIADDQGRMVLLHGAIPASLLEFGPGTGPFYPIDPVDYENGQCPANSPSSRYPPLCQADLDAMAALGFNSIRLPLSWSLLEPARGQFSNLYLDRVAQIVGWARDLHMYVILDMHQNAFSHYVGAGDATVDLSYDSGAPKWATLTDGFPSTVLDGQRELNPAVLEATTNFWYDRDGIQDEYLATLAFIAKRFRDDSAVAGYSVYNEPLPGWNLPPGFEDLLLFPFYRRAIDAITGLHDGLPCWSGFFMPAPCGYRDLGVDDRHHLVFLDAGLLRMVTDFPTHLGLPVSAYPNVVLSIHAYTHVFTIDALMKQKAATANYPWGGYDQGYSFAEREARAMDAALFVAEFGNSPGDDNLILKAQLTEQEQHHTGYAFWPWKENSGATWGVFNPPASPTDSSGCLRVSRERYLASVYPRASADPRAGFHYDSSNGSFTLDATGRIGDPSTVVYVPAEVTGQITSAGGATVVVSHEDGGARVVLASPTGGAFTIAVAPAPLAITGC